MFAQSSGELKGLHDEPQSLYALWVVPVLGFAGTGGILLLGPGGEEQAGVLGVADGGLGVEAEYRCQVQRVGPGGEGFLELPVDAQPFQGRGLAAEFALGEVDRADWVLGLQKLLKPQGTLGLLRTISSWPCRAQGLTPPGEGRVPQVVVLRFRGRDRALAQPWPGGFDLSSVVKFAAGGENDGRECNFDAL
jgi:hypothetical protein